MDGADIQYHHRVLTRLKSTKAAVLAGSLSFRSGNPTVVVTGLGSGSGGQVLTRALCANASGRGAASGACLENGIIACSRVSVLIL